MLSAPTLLAAALITSRSVLAASAAATLPNEAGRNECRPGGVLRVGVVNVSQPQHTSLGNDGRIVFFPN